MFKLPLQPYYKNSYHYWSTHINPSVKPGVTVMTEFLDWLYNNYPLSVNDTNTGYFSHFLFETESDRTIFMLKWG